MRHIAAIVLSLCACTVLWGQDDPLELNSYDLKPGEIGAPCDPFSTEGVYLIQETGEFWECPDSTALWTLVPILSTAVPAPHATDHMTGGTNTDPIAPYTQDWTRKHSIVPSTDEVSLTLKPTATSPTAEVFNVYDDDGLKSVRTDPSGRTAFGDAGLDATVNIKGGKPAEPTDEPTLEFWFRAEDISEACGIGKGSGTNLGTWNDASISATSYTLTGSGGAIPDVVCGACCTETGCTNDYMPGDTSDPPYTDCGDFTNLDSTNIPVHVETFNGDEYLNLTPNYTIQDETFTIIALIWQHFPGVSDEFMSDATGTGDYLEYFQNRGIGSKTAGAPDWSVTGCADVDFGVATLDGDECNDAGNDCDAVDCANPGDCGDTTDGDGPGDWYVFTVQITADTASETLTMDEARVNGTDRKGAMPDLSGCSGSGGDFQIARFGSHLKVAEIMGFAGDLATADIQLWENYLANKYSLGTGADHNGGNLDEDAAGLGTGRDALICETENRSNFSKLDSDCRMVITQPDGGTGQLELQDPVTSAYCRMRLASDGTLTFDGTLSGCSFAGGGGGGTAGATGDVQYRGAGGGHDAEAAFNYDEEANRLGIDGTASIGVGTLSPDEAVEIIDGTDEQLMLTNTDATDFCKWKVDASGNLTRVCTGAGLNNTTYCDGAASDICYDDTANGNFWYVQDRTGSNYEQRLTIDPTSKGATSKLIIKGQDLTASEYLDVVFHSDGNFKFEACCTSGSPTCIVPESSCAVQDIDFEGDLDVEGLGDFTGTVTASAFIPTGSSSSTEGYTVWNGTTDELEIGDGSSVLNLHPIQDFNTEAEAETLIFASANVIVSTEIDTGAELAAIMTDETGSGANVHQQGPVLNDYRGDVEASKTAGSGNQGSGVCSARICHYSTVGIGGDATLPAAISGLRVTIIHRGLSPLQVWPASGDDCGAGVNNNITVTAGNKLECVTWDATTWDCNETTKESS